MQTCEAFLLIDMQSLLVVYWSNKSTVFAIKKESTPLKVAAGLSEKTQTHPAYTAIKCFHIMIL